MFKGKSLSLSKKRQDKGTEPKKQASIEPNGELIIPFREDMLYRPTRK